MEVPISPSGHISRASLPPTRSPFLKFHHLLTVSWAGPWNLPEPDCTMKLLCVSARTGKPPGFMSWLFPGWFLMPQEDAVSRCCQKEGCLTILCPWKDSCASWGSLRPPEPNTSCQERGARSWARATAVPALPPPPCLPPTGTTQSDMLGAQLSSPPASAPTFFRQICHPLVAPDLGEVDRREGPVSLPSKRLGHVHNAASSEFRDFLSPQAPARLR